MTDPKFITSEIDKRKYEIARIEYEIEQLSSELSKILETHVRCPSCKEFISKKDLLIDHKTKTSRECVLQDAGYGDDDILADVTRYYTMRVCPNCRYVIEENSFVLSETNRHTRR